MVNGAPDVLWGDEREHCGAWVTSFCVRCKRKFVFQVFESIRESNVAVSIELPREQKVEKVSSEQNGFRPLSDDEVENSECSHRACLSDCRLAFS